MDLRGLLSVIAELAKANDIREPYIVGGLPRDIIMGFMDSLNDIDLTNGDSSISRLADLVGQKLGVAVMEMSDGHKKIRFDRFSIDFSTNQIYGNIDELLLARGMSPASDLIRETFSRDFTMNTLLLPLDFSKVLDLTAMARYDIGRKVIRCPVDANVCLQHSPNRIIRAFYYSAKYGFALDSDLKSAIKNNLNLLSSVKQKYASDKLSVAIKYNKDIIDDLIELGVLHKIKLTKDITDALISSKRLVDVI
jgi:tRNA nucleotidyltransferase/poly(A) polymerase